MTVRSFLHLPPAPRDPSARRLWEVLSQVRKGKMDIVGEVTLTANAASTTITDNRISPQSVIVWHPRTANAAAEMAAGTMYITDANMANGSAVVTHANNAQGDRSFRFAVLG